MTNRRAAIKNMLWPFRIFVSSVIVMVLVANCAFATPSTTFWTPMTLDIQPYGVFHLGMDNYFVVRNPSTSGALPTDFTIPTVGVLPFNKIQMEVGADYWANTTHPWLLNAKFGSPEGSFFKNQPAFEIGIFNAGKKFDAGRADLISPTH